MFTITSKRSLSLKHALISGHWCQWSSTGDKLGQVKAGGKTEGKSDGRTSSGYEVETVAAQKKKKETEEEVDTNPFICLHLKTTH